MRCHAHVVALLFCTSVATVGCGSADQSVAESAPAFAESATIHAESETSNSAPTPDLAEPDSLGIQVVEFTPPFPDRLDLFEPPKRAQGTVRRDEEHGETVELKGFVNVDQPRVVLSIDGVISPVAEGGEKYGVQVISIQPPSVVLQRGRNRWTATLE